MVKQRISLTLDEQLVQQLDREVDEGAYTNRSQAVESLLKESIQPRMVEKAVVLSGGDDEEPDAMIRVNEKPIIHHIVNYLDESGISTIYIATDTDSPVIEYFESTDCDLAADLVYLEEETPAGTAGALRNIEANDTVLLINGDVLCRVDIGDMLSHHRDTDVPATMALTTVEDPSPYGVVKVKGDRIIGFTQQPEEDVPSKLINAGVYLLDPEIIDNLPSEAEKQEIDIETVFNNLATEKRLQAYVYEGEWQDLGR